MKYYNIHTHQASEQSDEIVIVNTIIREEIADEKVLSRYKSYGIHPWHITDPVKQLTLFTEALRQPNVVAVGEAGLDKLADTSMDIQIAVFRSQIELADQRNLPLIIHCVKAWDELLALKKELSPRNSWIIHAFRGNGELAAQLIRHGCNLSFGLHFNPEAVRAAWPHHLFAETDDKEIDIRDVYRKIASSLAIPEETLMRQIAENSQHIFLFG